MTLIYTKTRRQLIEMVAERWKHQYREYYARWADEKLAKLEALDLSSCSRDAVDKIIGNTTWTDNHCGVCGKDVEVVVNLGEREDSDDSGVDVCGNCLKKAVEMIGKVGES